MNKSILVTGGLGFIGFHLCKQLLENEPTSHLTIVDNLSSTKIDYRSLCDRSTILINDLRELKPTARHYDEIYHLASPVGSVGILAKNGFIASDIIELAQKAADIAKASKGKLLYLSSSEVYGRDGQHAESVELIVPPKRGARMEYSLGKLAAEHVLLNRALDEPFDIRIVRPFNVAGEWQSAHLGFVLPKFFEAALANQPLTVYGTGTQRRSFCHVSDLVRGVIAVQNQAPANDVYNLGNPDNIVTIESLAHQIHELCNSRSAIQHVDPYALHGKRFMEAFDKIPNIQKALSCSKWKPSVNLSTTLQRLHTFYIKQRETVLNIQPDTELA